MKRAVRSTALKPLLEDISSTAQDSARLRGISIEVDAPEDAIVEGDAFLLRRAISNLLDNAIDFSDNGGKVRMSLKAGTRIARIQVQDEGPGIPDYAMGKVFEKFYSLARPHSRKKSTGLGLAFVKEIASLHHGRIELVNAAEKGAVATLSLPLVAG